MDPRRHDPRLEHGVHRRHRRQRRAPGDPLEPELLLLGQPVGFAVAATSPFSSLTDQPCVTIDQLYVVPDSRKHGVARQLMSAVTLYADSRGCEQIGCNVPAQHRDANRFFARLGFACERATEFMTAARLKALQQLMAQMDHAAKAGRGARWVMTT